RVRCNAEYFIFVLQYPVNAVLQAHLVVAREVRSMNGQPLPPFAAQRFPLSELEEPLLVIRALRVQVRHRVDAATKVQLVGEVDGTEGCVPLGQLERHAEADALA